MSAPHTNASPEQEKNRPRVVIVGAGFAGIEAPQALRGAPVDVMLIDRNNYHKFQPLLYLIAFLNWVYNYLTYDRKARMIVDTVPLHRTAEPSVRRIRRKLQSLENGESVEWTPER